MKTLLLILFPVLLFAQDKGTLLIEGRLKDIPQTYGTVLKTIPENTELKLLSLYRHNYILVKYDGTEGYLMDVYFKQTPKFLVFVQRETLLLKYSNAIIRRIMNREYWIDMTDDMARASLGNPEKVNASTGSWGIHEQWIYDGIYLYFKNGVLSSYQN